MAITKVSNSGFKSGMTKYDSFLAGNDAYDPAATWLIQRVTATGSETSITFSSIPSTYQHLQIRIFSHLTSTAANQSGFNYLRFNSDTGNNYVRHRLEADGATITADGATAQNSIMIPNSITRQTGSATIWGVGIIDIHDYASTTKNKTIRYFSGAEFNLTDGTSKLSIGSGLWLSTSAITSITLPVWTSAYSSGSTFALYGYKGA